jgi:tetratricopeptide (TPR) repeat protein
MGWYLLSQVERRTGRLDEAEAAARRILAQNADDARGLLALSEVMGARGDHAGVIRTLESRVGSPKPGDEGPVHSRLAVDLAVAYQASGQPDRAVKVLEGALARSPDDGDLLFDLGAAYERAGQFAAAEQAFRQVIEAEPRHGAALNYLGYMLADRGTKLDEALSLVRRALEAEPDNPSYLDSLGWAYFKLGRAAEARDPLARAAAARPRASVIQEHLGDVYFELKQYRAAAEAFERALSGDREGIDAAAVTKKRDRARVLAGD